MDPATEGKNEVILAFLDNEIGLEAMRRGDLPEAVRRFEGAIDLDARAVPAYLNLGDVRVAQGRDMDAVEIWERLIDVAPDRAYLAFERLEAIAVRSGSPERFTRLCRRLIDDNPQDWRARLALSRHLAAGGHATRRAGAAVRGARPESARARHPSGDLAGARTAAVPVVPRRSLQRAHAARGVLSRPARLHAVPIPQHGTPVAVPSLPRLEHVRRRTHRAGAGSDRGRGLIQPRRGTGQDGQRRARQSQGTSSAAHAGSAQVGSASHGRRRLTRADSARHSVSARRSVRSTPRHGSA